MIKAVLFDLGDVLINNSFAQVLAEISKNLNIKEEDINSLNNEYRDKLMIGELSVKDFNRILKQRLNLPISEEEILNVWAKSYEAVRTINDGLYEVVKNLKKRYIVGMVSNIYDLTTELDRKRGLFDQFDPCILSSEVGLAKPHAEIFQLALQKAGLNANECVFIDNREGHLVSPKELGFHTILFVNNEETIRQLINLGIEI